LQNLPPPGLLSTISLIVEHAIPIARERGLLLPVPI
jgi:hypothetical protein